MNIIKKYGLIILVCLITYSCRAKKEIDFNNYFLYNIDDNNNIDLEEKYYTLFLVCIKYNLPISYFISMTQFSVGKTREIIYDLKSTEHIKIKDKSITPAIFIADNNDKKGIQQLAQKSAEKIATLIQTDSTYIKTEYKKLEVSKTLDFEQWSFVFIGDILIGQSQLGSIRINLLKDTINNYQYQTCYNSIIENNNPVLNNFYYNNYIGGTSASSTYEFGNYNYIKKDYWRTSENQNIISAEDNFKLYQISFDYSKKLIPILKSNIEEVKFFYNNSHFKNEISFNVFYYWYYHFVYTESIQKLINKNILTKQERNFKYTRLNYCG